MVSYLAMLIPLSLMMVSDWKTRTVTVSSLMVLFLLAGVGSVLNNGMIITLLNLALNLTILGLLLVVLKVYSCVRRIPLAELGGLGDFLFFVALTPLFSPDIYIRLVVVMLMDSLLLWFVLRKKYNLKSIPLVTFCGFSFIPAFILFLHG